MMHIQGVFISINGIKINSVLFLEKPFGMMLNFLWNSGLDLEIAFVHSPQLHHDTLESVVSLCPFILLYAFVSLSGHCLFHLLTFSLTAKRFTAPEASLTAQPSDPSRS